MAQKSLDDIIEVKFECTRKQMYDFYRSLGRVSYSNRTFTMLLLYLSRQLPISEYSDYEEYIDSLTHVSDESI